MVAFDPSAAARDERHMPLCRKGELGILWREHRLPDVSEEALTIRTRFSSFDDYWSPRDTFSPAPRSRGVTATPATAGSIDGEGPFHELLIAQSFYEGQTHGQGERAACA
jgi:hypothetical protein